MYIHRHLQRTLQQIHFLVSFCYFCRQLYLFTNNIKPPEFRENEKQKDKFSEKK